MPAEGELGGAGETPAAQWELQSFCLDQGVLKGQT